MAISLSFSFNTCFLAGLLYTAVFAKADRNEETMNYSLFSQPFKNFLSTLRPTCVPHGGPSTKKERTLSFQAPSDTQVCTHTKSCRNTACLRSHTIIPEDACNSTTSPVGLSSVEGPLCPQITQSYIASETCCSDVATSMAISASGDSKNG